MSELSLVHPQTPEGKKLKTAVQREIDRTQRTANSAAQAKDIPRVSHLNKMQTPMAIVDDGTGDPRLYVKSDGGLYRSATLERVDE
jgi:hypothetical protein